MRREQGNYKATDLQAHFTQFPLISYYDQQALLPRLPATASAEALRPLQPTASPEEEGDGRATPHRRSIAAQPPSNATTPSAEEREKEEEKDRRPHPHLPRLGVAGEREGGADVGAERPSP